MPIRLTRSSLRRLVTIVGVSAPLIAMALYFLLASATSDPPPDVSAQAAPPTPESIIVAPATQTPLPMASPSAPPTPTIAPTKHDSGAPTRTGTPGDSKPTGSAPTGGGKGTVVRPGDGVWQVGTVLPAGDYTATVPSNSAGCTWSRHAKNHDLITSGQVPPGHRITVTISTSDALFTTHGCGQWQPAV